MLRYILKKILLALPVLLGITLLDYALMCAAGSPIEMMTGPRMTEEAIALKAQTWGLDQPLWKQYLGWMGELLQGNLGYSYKSYQPVSAIIGDAIGPTLLLMGASMVVGLLIAVPAGIYSAVHRYKKRDYAVVTGSFLASSIPSFFLAMLLVYVFTVVLGWLPSSGMTTPGTGGDWLDVLRHMVMPVMVLAVFVAGSNIRYIRAAVLEILEKDYLRTAKAKGVSGVKIIFGHALKNSLIPVITYFGPMLAFIVTGSMVVEQIFAVPGIGRQFVSSITNRDYTMIMGTTIFLASLIVIMNLISDLLYKAVDPRIEFD